MAATNASHAVALGGRVSLFGLSALHAALRHAKAQGAAALAAEAGCVAEAARRLAPRGRPAVVEVGVSRRTHIRRVARDCSVADLDQAMALAARRPAGGAELPLQRWRDARAAAAIRAAAAQEVGPLVAVVRDAALERIAALVEEDRGGTDADAHADDAAALLDAVTHAHVARDDGAEDDCELVADGDLPVKRGILEALLERQYAGTTEEAIRLVDAALGKGVGVRPPAMYYGARNAYSSVYMAVALRGAPQQELRAGAEAAVSSFAERGMLPRGADVQALVAERVAREMAMLARVAAVRPINGGKGFALGADC